MTIDARVEMFHSDQWNTITGDVDMDAGITIGYGQPDQHSEPVPTSCALQLDDRDGDYRPLDPTSSLYGLAGLGTRMRVRIGDPQPVGMLLNGVTESDSYASTPDHASLDITGDIDVRVDLEMVTWRPLTVVALAGKFLAADSQMSWALSLRSAGGLRLTWSVNGTDTGGNRHDVDSTDVVPFESGRLAVRATLDVNNGVGGHTATFYTAPTLAGSWTQLGDPVTVSGTTSIFSGAAELAAGALSDGTSLTELTVAGVMYGLEVRNGIGGTAVANPDFTAADPDDTSFTDAAGRTWTVHDSASILDVSLRSHTEALTWTPHVDETTLDVKQAIDSRGILERLGNGDDEPLQSAVRRGILGTAPPIAYWPCEDGSNATQIASDSPAGPMTLGGSPSFAANDDFACSENLPTFNGSAWSGVVPSYDTSSGEVQVRFLLTVPAGGDTDGALVMRVSTVGGTTGFIDLFYGSGSGGTLTLNLYDAAGALLHTTGAVGFNLNGRPVRLSLGLTQNGADVDWILSTVGLDAVGGFVSGTLTGRTFSRVEWLYFSNFQLTGTAAGHVTVQDQVTDIFALLDELTAFIGEPAGRRIARLCFEEGIPFEGIGYPEDTPAMGPQRPAQFLDLIAQCRDVDLGLVYEPRRPGLGYRTQSSMVKQDPALELDMADGTVINPFSPPLDNTHIQNDITVARQDGSSVRVVKETGPGPGSVISVKDMGPGSVASVGRRKGGATLNLETDLQLPDHAYWRLHLGTVVGHRIAVLEVELEHHPELQQAVLELRPGDLIRLTNPPPGMPPGPIDLLALGWTDTITDQTWRWSCHLTPAEPYRVGVYNDPVSRWDSINTYLDEDLDTTETDIGMLITGTPAPLWTTAAADFPFNIVVNGEVMTVTAIATTGANAQTFTVIRQVNGVVKTHIQWPGAPSNVSRVQLADPVYYGRSA